MREEGAPDVHMAALATRQQGMVGRSQLLAIGLSSAAIARRVAATMPVAAPRLVHVTVGRGGRRGHTGIGIHRRTLAPDEVTDLDGLPITTPERTLLDLAATRPSAGGRSI